MLTPHKRFDPNAHYAVQDPLPAANTDHVKRKFLDIPCADLSPAQKLDVYLPDEGDGPFPFIVSLHGGAFMGCDKEDVQVLPMLEGMDEQLAERGLPPEPGTEHNGANSPESLLLGQQITAIPDWVRAANPETYINPAAPPFFLQHGTMDPIVPVQMSINFAAKLEQVLGRDRVQLELLEGAEHGDPQFETPENVKKVLDFLDRHLKNESSGL